MSYVHTRTLVIELTTVHTVDEEDVKFRTLHYLLETLVDRLCAMTCGINRHLIPYDPVVSIETLMGQWDTLSYEQFHM